MCANVSILHNHQNTSVPWCERRRLALTRCVVRGPLLATVMGAWMTLAETGLAALVFVVATGWIFLSPFVGLRFSASVMARYAEKARLMTGDERYKNKDLEEFAFRVGFCLWLSLLVIVPLLLFYFYQASIYDSRLP